MLCNATDCRLQAIGKADCSATLVFVSSLSLLIILTLGRQREREVPFLDVTSCPILPFCLQSNAIRGLFIVRICLDVDHYDYYSRLHVWLLSCGYYWSMFMSFHGLVVVRSLTTPFQYPRCHWSSRLPLFHSRSNSRHEQQRQWSSCTLSRSLAGANEDESSSGLWGRCSSSLVGWFWNRYWTIDDRLSYWCWCVSEWFVIPTARRRILSRSNADVLDRIRRKIEQMIEIRINRRMFESATTKTNQSM